MAKEIDHLFTDQSIIEHVADPKIFYSLIKYLKHLFQHSTYSFAKYDNWIANKIPKNI